MPGALGVPLESYDFTKGVTARHGASPLALLWTDTITDNNTDSGNAPSMPGAFSPPPDPSRPAGYDSDDAGDEEYTRSISRCSSVLGLDIETATCDLERSHSLDANTETASCASSDSCDTAMPATPVCTDLDLIYQGHVQRIGALQGTDPDIFFPRFEYLPWPVCTFAPVASSHALRSADIADFYRSGPMQMLSKFDLLRTARLWDPAEWKERCNGKIPVAEQIQGEVRRGMRKAVKVVRGLAEDAWR